MDAHGYGGIIEIFSEKLLDPATVEELLKRIVTEVGGRCMEAGARAIGHIKCYLKTDRGYAKADIVRLRQGAFAEVRLDGPIRGGTLVINSIVLGLPDGEVERTTKDAIGKVLAEYCISLREMQECHGDH